MSVRMGRTAIRDLDVRRELRRPLVCACVLGALALLTLSLALSLDALAHARERHWELHAYWRDARIEKTNGDVFVSIEGEDGRVPVTVNDPSDWSQGEWTEVFINQTDNRDVRIATETKAFLGPLYTVQVWAWVIFVLTVVPAAVVGFVLFFKRSILAAHPWRSIEIRSAGRRHWFVAPADRSRFGSRAIPCECREVQIAGPLQPALRSYSIIRLDNSPKLRVVRGPRFPVEGLVEPYGAA